MNNEKSMPRRGKVINKTKPIMSENHKIKRPRIDWTFFMIVFLLLFFGLVMVYTASYAKAISQGLPPDHYSNKQIFAALLGLLAMWFFSRFNYNHLSRGWLVALAFGGSLFLMLLTKVPGLGVTHNGATRWLKIGIEFQPSEFMKLAVIMLFAYYISKYGERAKTEYTMLGKTINTKKYMGYWWYLLPLIIALGVIVLVLMSQPHLSCTILICAIAFILLLVGETRIVHLLSVAAIGVVGLTGIVLYKIHSEGFGYFEKRFSAWLHPFENGLDTSWQTQQSLIAIGTGGWTGLGLGQSRQKFSYLPEPENDFIFAIICEELGFVAAITLILMFVVLVYRGFYIASKSPNKFGMLLVIGITTQIGLQALLNIAVVTNTIPNTGISLPFFSYGGTALAMQLAEMGMVLGVSRKMLE
ncbi:MAG: putative lipid II flippase FtsW [Ruminococcus sp.]|nr:putative lipid II flippase FtsW [Ruminococcus sp.]